MAVESNLQPFRVAIVGGGIAGLGAALTLLKRQRTGANIELVIYEAAHQFAEIGAGVAFGPNALTALKMMGAEDIMHKVAAPSGDPNVWFDYKIGQAAHPHCGDTFCQVKGTDSGKGYVHRADFLDLVIAQLPKELGRFSQRCTGYTPHETGITIHFTESSPICEAEADVIVDATGIKSPLRTELYKRKGWPASEQQAFYSKWIAWRGLIPRDVYHEAMGKDTSPKNMHLGSGRHILTFPVRGGEIVNLVGFVRDENDERLNGRTGPWSEERPKEEMLRDFDSFNDNVKRLLQAISKPSIWGIWELPKLRTSIDEKIVLIGDAAHATTPHQGAGAGQGIEDALFIGELLAQVADQATTKPDRNLGVRKALEAYQETRHERSSRVVATSREAGFLYEFMGVHGEGDDVEKLTKSLTTRLGWIWGYDMQSELDRALQMASLR